MSSRLQLLLPACLLVATLAGCRGVPTGQPGAVPIITVGNPLLVSGDPQFVFDQVVDAIDNYFKIENEQRVQAIGGVLTPGRIDTFPVVGATLLEPWRADYTLGPETLYNTLQVVRRFAVVEIIPSEGGYLVSVQVMRELEDIAKPDQANASDEVRRHDGSLVTPEERDEAGGQVRLGWIPIGRDVALEQKIMADIQSRLNFIGPEPLPPIGP